MILRKYGIVLRRLKEADLELVRRMRNSSEIRRYMHFRDKITKKMQKEWFISVNNKENYYFIIEHTNKKIGLIHGKNNNYEQRYCEGGIFIWNTSYIGTFIPSLASVILNDLTFHTFQNMNIVYAKVVKGNNIAFEYNKLMGYQPCPPPFNNNDKEIQWMKLTKENYLKHIGVLRKAIFKLTGDGEPLTPKEIDISDDSPEDIQRLYIGLPDSSRQIINSILSRPK